MNRITHETKTPNEDWRNTKSNSTSNYISVCCDATMHSDCSDEGTCCAVCYKCKKPCNWVSTLKKKEVKTPNKEISKMAFYCAKGKLPTPSFMDREIMPRLWLLALFAFLISIISIIGWDWSVYKLREAVKMEVEPSDARMVVFNLGDCSTTSLKEYKKEVKEKKEREWIIDEIKRQSEEYGVSFKDALRIAECESSLNPKAQNPSSTAKGLYQFISKTWDNYCWGDVYDYKANIHCFMVFYPIYPNWWKCSKN